jgi:hypothetical protein
MALIEYELVYVNNQPQVTYTVLEVDTSDKIQFKCDYPGEGIQYNGDSPFLDPKAPRADEAFPVNGLAGPFDVAKTLTAGEPINFACGKVAAAKAVPAGAEASRTSGPEPRTTYILTPWSNGKGQGTPPNNH